MKRVQREDKTSPTRHYSKKQEEGVANKFSGHRQLNSGATPFEKGDVVLDDWLIECKTKTTESKSMSVQKEWLEKNLHESLFMGKKYNAIAFNFGPNEKNYYIIDEDLFETLVAALRGVTDET